ncbi:MAG: UDP-N-acetylmuramoyl-tripeptide--D-alanyl-D-alanine ligase [Erysipelotrichaceae bacterium]
MNIRIISMLALLLFMTIPSIHCLHVYQQQHYQIDRYLTWCYKQRYRSYLSWRSLFYYIPFLGIAWTRNLWLLILLLLVDSYLLFKVEKNTVYSKKIVYTNRMKRLCLMLILLEVTFLCLYVSLLNPIIQILLAFLCSMAPAVLLIGAAACCMPLEEAIKDYYMKDAQNMLIANQHCKVIGITGSFGKTSTKNIVNQLLSSRYYCFMTPASYNNKMGIALSIRNYIKPYHEYFICEIGGDHIHEIKTLAEFVNPQIAIITGIGPQHLQTFGSIQNILEEKMQLVEHLSINGYAICNRDNDYIRHYKIKNRCHKIWFGIEQKDVDYRGCNIQCDECGTSFDVIAHFKTISFKTKLLGEHNVLNLLAGIAIGDLLNIPMEEMKRTIEQIPYVKHRLEIIKNKDYTIIDNSYNSNPVSASYALKVLSQMPGRKIIITPGFIDLGKEENFQNRKLGRSLSKVCDEIILVGKKQSQYIMKGLKDEEVPYEKVRVVKNRNEAFDELRKIVIKGDYILIENDLPDAYNQ